MPFTQTSIPSPMDLDLKMPLMTPIWTIYGPWDPHGLDFIPKSRSKGGFWCLFLTSGNDMGPPMPLTKFEQKIIHGASMDVIYGLS